MENTINKPTNHRNLNPVSLGRASSHAILGVPPEDSLTGTTDISRGAHKLAIPAAAVLLQSKVIDDYRELDPSLGLSTVGVILAATAAHLSTGIGGRDEDTVTVSLLRRDDWEPVEVELRIYRTRCRGAERLVLRKVSERETHPQPTLSDSEWSSFENLR